MDGEVNPSPSARPLGSTAQHQLVRATAAEVEPAALAAGGNVRLGRRRKVVVVHAPLPPEVAKLAGVAAAGAIDVVTAACLRLPECEADVDLQAASGSLTTSSAPGPSSAPPSPPQAAAAASAALAPASAPAAVKTAATATANGWSQGTEGSNGAIDGAGQQQADVGTNIFGSYISNWFSPTKAALASHPLPLAPDEPLASGPLDAFTPRAPTEDHNVPRQLYFSPSQGPVGAGGDGASNRQQRGKALEVLREHLEETAGSAGLVHLGLHPVEGGLVLCWQQRVQAVVEPGESDADVCACCPTQLSCVQCWCPSLGRAAGCGWGWCSAHTSPHMLP